ncbi:transcription initiation factor TFIID subunit 9 [Drosophila sulfurigaster albostrigata]|uniref:Transcription initiation factor TFIID subunit 9 n=1 Tax=Drosophila albomicans TaxID=7291 RepID=A0A6P8XRE6_DROAB|nr:transcription initiation factor TFIID subunit 9 [Drosophila albomicans]XP_060650304.1 transcription initiation factor TFIID subunit 9 [Drosophila nasuta]XP_062126885.1 transcription initiation factor TFIID subunit 9 [Drosophila sulfurigaster albostrigata]
MSGEKAEKAKVSAQIKHVPKDAQVIMSILKELNIQEYEPRVVNQMLEFTFRYVTCILDDAKVYANHARKKTIDLDDVRLATEMTLDKSFTGPPPRHVLAKMAELRNAMPLPPIKPHCGLRLPPDRYCLTGVNYKLRATNQPKKMTKSALEGRSVKTVVKPVSSANGAKRGHSMVSKQQVVTIPKPVIKFTTTTKTVSAMDVKNEPNSTDMKMEVDSDAAAVGSIGGSNVAVKRERDEEEFEFTTN